MGDLQRKGQSSNNLDKRMRNRKDKISRTIPEATYIGIGDW